jgi:hypothetical protein
MIGISTILRSVLAMRRVKKDYRRCPLKHRQGQAPTKVVNRMLDQKKDYKILRRSLAESLASKVLDNEGGHMEVSV